MRRAISGHETQVLNGTKRDHLRLYLLGIVLLGFGLRLVALGDFPVGFHADEAAIGYDAFCLLKTGSDQYGVSWPFFARSFGDYDESLYRFLTVPSVAVFGLNAFAVRLPSALAGGLTVLVVFLLMRELFDRQTALVAALLLAICPWHILFSRWAVRVTLLPLFFCSGLYFFYYGLRQPNRLFWAAALFGLSLHTYNSARVFVPLFVLGLGVCYRRQLWVHKYHSLGAALLFVSVVALLFPFWVSDAGMARARDTLDLSFGAVVDNYLSYFDPRFLFFYGDPNLRHHVPMGGALPVFEIITLVMGLFASRHLHGRLFVIWALLYPIPAALTEPGHAIRSFQGVPLFAMLSASGLVWGFRHLSAVRLRFVMQWVCAVVILLSSAVFLKHYFVDYPKMSAQVWQFGLREAFEVTEHSAYDKIIVSYAFSPPYIFILFYTKFSPHAYLQLPMALREGLWRYTNEPLGRYYSASIGQLFLSQTCLLILVPDDLPVLDEKQYQWRKIHTVKDHGGIERVFVVEVQF